MFRIEHNVETGEITEIELTAEEIEQIKNRVATETAIANQKDLAKTELLAKLGITEDEAKLLLG